jgi:hypothetical protein
MPENWESDFMAMCCGLSLAVALGWNVTAGAADWHELAQNLCIISPTQGDTADWACAVASQAADVAPGYVAMTLSP